MSTRYLAAYLPSVASNIVTGQASLAGVGSLTATAHATLIGQASLSGVGSLTATGTTGTTQLGQASLAGAGSLTCSAVVIAVGQASLSGVGSLTATAGAIRSASASLAGVGSLTAIGEVGIEGRASLAGVGSLTVSGGVIRTGQASLIGEGSLSVSAVAIYAGQVSMAGVGTLTAIGESGVDLYTVFGNVLGKMNPDEYPPNTQFFLEVVLWSTNPGDTARARLFNITDGVEVSGSPVSTTSTTPVMLRSGTFTLPSGEKTYRVEYGGTAGGSYEASAARVRWLVG